MKASIDIPGKVCCTIPYAPAPWRMGGQPRAIQIGQVTCLRGGDTTSLFLSITLLVLPLPPHLPTARFSGP